MLSTRRVKRSRADIPAVPKMARRTRGSNPPYTRKQIKMVVSPNFYGGSKYIFTCGAYLGYTQK